MPHRAGSHVELERTFLARTIPAEIVGVQPVRILDVYVPEDPSAHSHVRLRRQGDTYEITKKTPIAGNDASALMEETIYLTAQEFDGLASSQKRIEKDRYRVMIGGTAAEVDVFRGALEELVLIDVEFASEQAKQAFALPACCLADVTQEDFIAGGNLAGKSYADIAPDLARYKYTKLSI